MEPYKKFIRASYVKMFNRFLKTVVEKRFERKYHQDIKLMLYGIKIKPNSKAYKSIPVEELLAPQAAVIFFIDSENPKLNTSDFIETLLYREGRTFLMLQDSTWFDEPDKFQIKFVFNKRPLYELDYKTKDSLNGEIEPSDDDIQKNMNESKTLLENTQQRQVISTVVKDIITLFKDNDDGEFYLPEDIDENKMTYEFSKLSTPFSVELTLEENENIDNFKINGEYAEDDDTITIVINYNPNKKRTLVYDLIGELNEIVAHEIRHIAQKEKGHFELGGSKEEDPYKYYTQPHELDALNFGFKRMARMTKKPIETLVQNWFGKNKDIHMLNPEQKKDVIKKILNYKK
jgi:hypothetical protein